MTGERFANVYQTDSGFQFVGMRHASREQCHSVASRTARRVALLHIVPKPSTGVTSS